MTDLHFEDDSEPRFVMPQVQTQRIRGGLTVLDLYGILFVALKLSHIIHWSWLFVLAPLWAPVIYSAIMFFAGRVVMRKIAKRRSTRW